MPNIGHDHIWLVDMIHDIVAAHGLDKECVPKLYKDWSRIRTDKDPVLTFGIQFGELGLGLKGKHGVMPSPLRTDADIKRVLSRRETAKMVVQGDAAGIERETDLVTRPKQLQELSDRTTGRLSARMVLAQHGGAKVQAMLQCGAPRTALPAVREPRPASDSGGEIGPLPTGVYLGHLADANATIQVAAVPDANPGAGGAAPPGPAAAGAGNDVPVAPGPPPAPPAAPRGAPMAPPPPRGAMATTPTMMPGMVPIRVVRPLGGGPPVYWPLFPVPQILPLPVLPQAPAPQIPRGLAPLGAAVPPPRPPPPPATGTKRRYGKTDEEKQAHRRETREAGNERRRKRRREERERKARPPDGGAALDADADRDADAAPN